MPRRTATNPPASHAVRQRIQRGGDRLWRYQDFPDLPFTAVAQALSRLARAGVIERVSKGIYYRARPTPLGPSRPNPAKLQQLAADRAPVYPAGAAAANLLGLSTQVPRRPEVATSAGSLPRKAIGAETVVHTRRPTAWSKLSQVDAALLDLLRRGGRTSELSPAETVRRTLGLLSERGRYERLARVARTEPPRVRALLGALGAQLGKDQRLLTGLRSSLNPLSRYDFGLFAGLLNARQWQAKGLRR